MKSEQEIIREIEEIEIKQLEEAEKEIEALIAEIQEDPIAFAMKKVNRFNEVIPTLPDRKPTKRGRITMKQHLLNIKENVENNRQGYSQRELDKQQKNLADTRKRLGQLKNKNNNESR